MLDVLKETRWPCWKPCRRRRASAGPWNSATASEGPANPVKPEISAVGPCSAPGAPVTVILYSTSSAPTAPAALTVPAWGQAPGRGARVHQAPGPHPQIPEQSEYSRPWRSRATPWPGNSTTCLCAPGTDRAAGKDRVAASQGDRADSARVARDAGPPVPTHRQDEEEAERFEVEGSDLRRQRVIVPGPCLWRTRNDHGPGPELGPGQAGSDESARQRQQKRARQEPGRGLEAESASRTGTRAVALRPGRSPPRPRRRGGRPEVAPSESAHQPESPRSCGWAGVRSEVQHIGPDQASVSPRPRAIPRYRARTLFQEAQLEPPPTCSRRVLSRSRVPEDHGPGVGRGRDGHLQARFAVYGQGAAPCGVDQAQGLELPRGERGGFGIRQVRNHPVREDFPPQSEAQAAGGFFGLAAEDLGLHLGHGPARIGQGPQGIAGRGLRPGAVADAQALPGQGGLSGAGARRGRRSRRPVPPGCPSRPRCRGSGPRCGRSPGAFRRP